MFFSSFFSWPIGSTGDEALKIIHTIAGLGADHGGPSRTVAALGSALSTIGIDVELITNAQAVNEEPPILPEHNSVNTHLLARQVEVTAFFPLTSRFARKLKQRIIDERSVIVHDHGIWLPTNHAVVRQASRKGWPTVISPRGMLTSWAVNYRRWKKRPAWLLYQKRDLQSVTCFHVTSNAEADDVRALGLGQPIVLIPNGVDVPDDYKVNPTKGYVRCALFLSRIHPKKGLINLIKAWAQVRPRGWRLVVAGPDENGYQAEVEREVRAAGLATEVMFSGLVNDEDKWAAYRQADLFVLPTFSENFGVVVAEALASGLPVITTKGTPWEQLETHGCGWWIDIGVDPLVKALKDATMLSDEARLIMGQRGRHLIAEHFTWLKSAEQMKSAYEWVLKRGPKPNCIRDD